MKIYMNRFSKVRHLRVLVRQKSKFNRLWLKKEVVTEISMVDWMKVAILADTCMKIIVATDLNTSGTLSGSNNSMKTTSTTTATTSHCPMTPAPNNIITRLVKNLSSNPLTVAHNSLLARGPNFTIVPDTLPNESILWLWRKC